MSWKGHLRRRSGVIVTDAFVERFSKSRKNCAEAQLCEDVVGSSQALVICCDS